MIKYKSIKTYERLKEIQSADPVIELGTKQEIDERLTQFQQQYSSKAFPDYVKREKPAGNQSAAAMIGSQPLLKGQSARRQNGNQNRVSLARKHSLQTFDNQRKVAFNGVSDKQSQPSIPQMQANTMANMTTTNIPSTVEFGDNFQSFIDNKFKIQLQRNLNQENAVVKMFGNALIATVFQSLVIKTIESLFKVSINVETNVPISSKQPDQQLCCCC